jgi:hypothetical protein
MYGDLSIGEWEEERLFLATVWTALLPSHIFFTAMYGDLSIGEWEEERLFLRSEASFWHFAFTERDSSTPASGFWNSTKTYVCDFPFPDTHSICLRLTCL